MDRGAVAGRLQVIGYRWAAATAPRVPRPIGLRLGARFGELGYQVIAGARRTVTNNLRQVLGPAAPADRIATAARRVFAHAGRNYFDFFYLPRLSIADFDRLVRVVGEDSFWDVHRRGQGIVIVTAHLGSFDAAAQILVARGIEALVLVEPLNPPELLEIAARVRRTHGLTIEPIGFNAIRQAREFLRSGKVVIVASDQPIEGRAESIAFFGAPARLPVGAIDLARRHEAAIVPAYAVRMSDDRFTVFVDPPLPLSRTGDRRRDVTDGLPLMRDSLQKYIGGYADQWVVFRPIWAAAAAENRSAVAAGAVYG